MTTIRSIFRPLPAHAKTASAARPGWRRHPENMGIIQVWLDRQWESASLKTLVKDKRNIPDDFPAEMLKYTAHACAYGVHPSVTVTCIWIMDAGV
jgi:hypothetical protein